MIDLKKRDDFYIMGRGNCVGYYEGYQCIYHGNCINLDIDIYHKVVLNFVI